MLLDKKILKRVSTKNKRSVYVVNEIKDVAIKKKDENLAKKLGRRIGELDKKSRDKVKKDNFKFNIDALTLIATCLTPEQTLAALAAELNIFRDYWLRENERWSSPSQKERNSLKKQIRDKNSFPGKSFVAVNNGRWKYNSHKKSAPHSSFISAGKLLSDLDEEKGENWFEYWPDLRVSDNTESHEQISSYISRAAQLLLNLNLLVRHWEYCETIEIENEKLEDYKNDIQAILHEMPDNSERQRVSNTIKSNDSDTIHKVSSEIWRTVRLSESVLGIVKRVVEPIGKLKEIKYYSSAITIRIPKDSLTRANEIALLGIIYPEIDKVNERLRKNPAPSMRSQRLRRIDFGDISQRLIILNEPKLGTGYIQISGTGNGIGLWLSYLAAKIYQQIDRKENITITIYDDLPKYRQLFTVSGDSTLDNPDFFELDDESYKHQLELGGGVYIIQNNRLGMNEKGEFIKGELKGVVIEDVKENITLDTFIKENISLRRYTTQAKRITDMTDSRYDIGIVVITPRELNGVQNYFSSEGGFERASGKTSHRTYLKKSIKAISGEDVNILVTRAVEQGQQSVVNAAQSLAKEAKPRIMVLLGIAGAIDDELDLGDVVFGDTVIYYEDRIESEEGTVRRLKSKGVPAWTLDKMGVFFADYGDPASFEGLNGEQFKVTQTPVGSGEAILKSSSSEIRKYLKDTDYRTAVVEKEAMGFLQYFFEQDLDIENDLEGVVIIRGISDKADIEKDDRYQVKAAENCMITLKHFINSVF